MTRAATAVGALVAVLAAGREQPPTAAARGWPATGRLRRHADHRRPRRAEHARAAGPRQLPARRAGRAAVLRQRPQRPALHPRQADEEAHDLSRPQRRRRTARPVPRVHLRTQFRHRPHQLRLRSRLRPQRRLLHPAHGGPDHRHARPRRPASSQVSTSPATRRRRPCRRPRPRAHRSRGRADRVDGPESPQRDLRGHGPRAAARARTPTPIHWAR